MDDFAYGIIAQREIEGRDGKNSADTDVSYGARYSRHEVLFPDSIFVRDGSPQLLSLYMALRDESGEPLSRQALRDALLNLIM